jgi:hypothetical protein
MSEVTRPGSGQEAEGAWYVALVRAERLRQEYAQHLSAADIAELELESLWLHLWLAERQRDELFRRLA